MIQLTRLNNQPLVVNSDLIKCVENAPDTVLTLVTGEKIIVRETTEQVIERVREFRRSVLMQSDVAADSGQCASAAEIPTPAVKSEGPGRG